MARQLCKPFLPYTRIILYTHIMRTHTHTHTHTKYKYISYLLSLSYDISRLLQRIIRVSCAYVYSIRVDMIPVWDAVRVGRTFPYRFVPPKHLYSNFLHASLYNIICTWYNSHAYYSKHSETPKTTDVSKTYTHVKYHTLLYL